MEDGRWKMEDGRWVWDMADGRVVLGRGNVDMCKRGMRGVGR